MWRLFIFCFSKLSMIRFSPIQRVNWYFSLIVNTSVVKNYKAPDDYPLRIRRGNGLALIGRLQTNED